MVSDAPAVECVDLGRVYVSRGLTGGKRETVALRDLSISIPKGMVFGLLGPNGAGKTTTVKILSTLLTPTSGFARIGGHDVVKNAGRVREQIGLILGGERGLYGRLTGYENLRYFAALNHMAPGDAKRRSLEMLELVGLADRGDTLVEQYSRGMRQRLHLARGLLCDPSVVFMDEPTIGVDPIGAQDLRDMVPQLVERGMTVLLTTHYMFEADSLCDRIAIINHGSLVALGTPREIKSQFSNMGVTEITIRVPKQGLVEEVSQLDGVLRATAVSDGLLQRIVVHTELGANLEQSVRGLLGYDNVEGVVTRDPTLEEAYVSILR